MISKESYLYLKPIDSDLLKKEIRYCYGNQWMYAKKENGKFGILTEALDCTIRRNDKLSEGIVEIVVCDHHEEEIKEESVRILTVSLLPLVSQTAGILSKEFLDVMFLFQKMRSA